MPSRANTSADQLARLRLLRGRGSGRRPRARVTCTPNRANACASSRADRAAADDDQRARAAPSSREGVTVGPVRRVREPVDRRRRRARCRCSARRPSAPCTSSPSTSTVRGPVSRAAPRTNVTPASTSRSTAIWSSQSAVASSRIRACTGAQSERDRALAGEAGDRVGPRRARRRRGSSSCSGCTRSRGTRRRPAGGRPRPPRGRPAPAGSATDSPPGPSPTTTTSTSSSCHDDSLPCPDEAAGTMDACSRPCAVPCPRSSTWPPTHPSRSSPASPPRSCPSGAPRCCPAACS